jgi:hypothetical protein
METYLTITDITGKQYPYNITAGSLKVNDFEVSEKDYSLDSIRYAMSTCDTIRVGNRIFRAEHIIEMSIAQYLVGAQ